MAALVATVAVWLLALPGQRFRMFPDGVSYLAIAEHLLAGRWGDAANAYWSPLYPWLLAPFLAVGADPFLAARLAGLVAALLAVLALARTCAAVGARPHLGGPVVLATVPFAVLASALATPDLLLVGVSLLATELVGRPAAAREDRAALVAGLAVGLGYLTKLVALPVLGGMALVVVTSRWWAARRRGDTEVAASTLRRGVVTLAGALAVVAAWGTVLTVATGTPTIGTAATVNLQVAAADASGSPICTDGLFAPATPDAANIWEDPAALPPSAPDTPSAGDRDGAGLLLGARQELERRWATVRRSLTEIERLRRWRLAAPVAMALHVPLLLAWRRRQLPDRTVATVAGLVVLAALTTAATLAVHLDERYLWAALVALLPGAVLGVQALDGAGWRRPAAGVLLVTLLIGVAVPAARGLAYDADRDHHLRELAQRIGADDDLQGLDVASDRAWPETMVLCLHLGCRYHGLVRPDRHGDFAEQLEAHDVDRFLWWDEDRPADAGADHEVVRRGGPLDGTPQRVVVEPLDAR